MAVCPVAAIFYVGSSLTTIVTRVAEKLQTKFPDVNPIAPMDDSQKIYEWRVDGY